MDLLGGILGKKAEDPQQEQEAGSGGEAAGKYNEQCSLCGASATDKKWAGKYFHRKCLRKMRKIGKGML